MKHACTVILVIALCTSQAHAGIFDNTPFDPKTWHRTIKNTPFDPKTWRKTMDDLRETNLGGRVCEEYAENLRRRYASNRGLNYTEKFYLRPWFGDLVDKVTVVWGASLNPEVRIPGTDKVLFVAAGAQTFGYNIYMRARRKTGDTEQMIGLAHELIHAWQFERLGGSLRNFCGAYSNGFFRAGMDYANNSFERLAFDFEIKFAHWLADKHPNYGVQTIVYQTGSPYQRRTVEIPERLRIPEPEYAVTCIENRTNFNVNYSFRWGDGHWQSGQVKAGGSRWHSWAYEGGKHSSADLEVKFDFDLSGRQRYVTHRLMRYRTKQESCRDAKKYYFAVKGNKLDLLDSERGD